MTEEQKIKIRRMRLDGNGYKHIASTLILPLSTVKRLKHTAGKKRKVFCSDKCRKQYWNLHNGGKVLLNI